MSLLFKDKVFSPYYKISYIPLFSRFFEVKEESVGYLQKLVHQDPIKWKHHQLIKSTLIGCFINQSNGRLLI